MTIYITYISIAVIAIVFIYFIYQTSKINKGRKIIAKALKEENLITALSTTKLSEIASAYNKSLNYEIDEFKKTNTPSAEFFSELSVCKAMNLNIQMTNAASSTLVGLGLLGTFLGLTLGILNFDSSNTENIKISIQSLLDGMGTAFFTSLAGMTTSIIYTMLEKPWKNKLDKAIFTLTEKLDDEFYIDDNALIQANIKSTLSLFLTYNNEEGNKVIISHAIREILKENEQQSAAIKSFTTDFAEALYDGLEQINAENEQEKRVPLIKSLIDHIDKMADTVASPATNMMESVVEELKESMTGIMNEFSKGLSGSATKELENLAIQLGTTTQAISALPKEIEKISETLETTISEVKLAVTEIASTSANTNSAALHEMQEQSNLMISNLNDAAKEMGQFLSETIDSLSKSAQQSFQNITDDVNNKQSKLIELQEDTTLQTKKLLDSFNIGLDRLEKLNNNVIEIMDSFKQAQNEITLSTTNLRSISGDMRNATEAFNKGQDDYATKLIQLQNNSQKSIDQITEMLKNSGQLTEEYVQKFNIIKQGLSSIFEQLQAGLNEYSQTVKDSTDRFLNQYTSSLTQTTGALSSAIEHLNETAETLSDNLERNKK